MIVPTLNKKALSERDICSKFITPALVSAKWDLMKESPIPIPPLAEQHRIVAKVEELMRWCDQLGTHLATAQTAGAHLLDSALKQILNQA